jgi:ATP-dependent DNA ligase
MASSPPPRGLPDFRALHFRKGKKQHLCVWAFDLLELNGRDLRGLPLAERKISLEKLLKKSRDTTISYSAGFDDAKSCSLMQQPWALRVSSRKAATAPTAPCVVTGSK